MHSSNLCFIYIFEKACLQCNFTNNYKQMASSIELNEKYEVERLKLYFLVKHIPVIFVLCTTLKNQFLQCLPEQDFNTLKANSVYS